MHLSVEEIDRLLIMVSLYPEARTREFRFGFIETLQSWPSIPESESENHKTGVDMATEIMESKEPIENEINNRKYKNRINYKSFELVRNYIYTGLLHGRRMTHLVSEAANKHGVATRTIYAWIQKGRERNDDILSDFVDGIVRLSRGKIKTRIDR